MPPKKNPPANAPVVVAEMAAKGHAEKSIAKHLGVSMPTFRRWKEEDDRIMQALEDGRAQEHDILVSSLLKTASDPRSPKSVTAAIFLLKARHGYRDDGGGTILQNAVKITFEVPGALKPDQYEAQALREMVKSGRAQGRALEAGGGDES